MSISNLWKQDLYINKNVMFLFNKVIIEYDLKEGGYSVSREYNILKQEYLDKLSKIKTKEERHRYIGILQRDDSIYKENLKKAFMLARKKFFEKNNIKDEDILSIKKDAIFVLKMCKHTEIGKYLNFRPKHYYTSYILLKPLKGTTLELYYAPDDFSVKGINDVKVKLHQDYMIKFLKMYFKKMETDESANVIEFTRRFIDKYKALELELGYYRNFNSSSDFTVIDESTVVWEETKQSLDITYNFFNVLLTLIKIPL